MHHMRILRSHNTSVAQESHMGHVPHPPPDTSTDIKRCVSDAYICTHTMKHRPIYTCHNMHARNHTPHTIYIRESR